MKTTDILIITLFIIESIIISYFIYIYLKNEKLNKLQREAELQKLQTVILDKIADNHTQQDNKINDITKKILESFEEFSKNVKLSQEQANSKVDLGFEQIQKENINITSLYDIDFLTGYNTLIFITDSCSLSNTGNINRDATFKLSTEYYK